MLASMSLHASGVVLFGTRSGGRPVAGTSRGRALRRSAPGNAPGRAPRCRRDPGSGGSRQWPALAAHRRPRVSRPARAALVGAPRHLGLRLYGSQFPHAVHGHLVLVCSSRECSRPFCPSCVARSCPKATSPRAVATIATHHVDAVERRMFEVLGEGESFITRLAARIPEQPRFSFAAGLIILVGDDRVSRSSGSAP